MSEHADTIRDCVRACQTCNAEAALDALELEIAEAQQERVNLKERIDEALRLFSLWEMSRNDEMGLDSESTLIAISETLSDI